MSEHAPTPLTIDEFYADHGSKIVAILDANGQEVAGERGLSKTNAQLFVTAVNAHDALIAACEAALPEIEFDSRFGDEYMQVMADQLRAALKLAQEIPHDRN